MNLRQKVFAALSALSTIATIGFCFAAVWSHGTDLPGRLGGSAMIALAVAFVAAAIASFPA